MTGLGRFPNDSDRRPSARMIHWRFIKRACLSLSEGDILCFSVSVIVNGVVFRWSLLATKFVIFSLTTQLLEGCYLKLEYLLRVARIWSTLVAIRKDLGHARWAVQAPWASYSSRSLSLLMVSFFDSWTGGTIAGDDGMSKFWRSGGSSFSDENIIGSGLVDYCI